MYKEYLLLLVLAHVIGDFYAQPDAMAKKKDVFFRWVVLHGVCYGIVVLIISAFAVPLEFWPYTALAAGVHFLIDTVKYCFKKHWLKQKKGSPGESLIFVMDQALHLAGLLVVVFLFARNAGLLCVPDSIAILFELLHLTPQMVLLWVTSILIVHKPANILIANILTRYKPDTIEASSKDKNAGQVIGSLERWIMLVLLSANQYAAIGLALTAKSITRYDKISKDQAFAEYYLLGTLLSTLIAILAAFIL